MTEDSVKVDVNGPSQILLPLLKALKYQAEIPVLEPSKMIPTRYSQVYLK